MAEVVDANKGQGGDGSTLASMVDKAHEVIPCECLEEERIPGSRIRFKLKLGEDVIAPRLKQTVREYARQVALPGFRRGKAPEALIRKRFEGPAREETVKRMLPRLCAQFTSERSLEPISDPYLLDLKSPSKEGATVELALEIQPVIEITDDKLQDIAVEVHRVPINEAYVDQLLARLQADNSTFEPTGEPFKEGDAALLTCTVSDSDGVVIEDRSVEEYYCTKVAEELPEEVAKALVGKSKGEELSLQIEEMNDLGEMEKIDYKVILHEVKARVLPELDDDFAGDVSGEFSTLAELRADLEKRGADRESERQRQETANEILSVLRERLDFDLPKGLVNNTAQRSMSSMEENLNQYGLSLRQLDQAMVQRYAQGTLGQARINVKNSLILRALGKHFALEPSEDDVKARLEELSARTGRKPLAIRAQLEARKEWGGFIEELSVKLVVDKLISLASVSHKDTTMEALEAIQRQRQEEQAAVLRGELQAVAQADRKYFSGPDVEMEETEPAGMESAEVIPMGEENPAQ